MATGHLNPGYKDVVSRLKRAKSANGRLHSPGNEDNLSLDEIRRRAKEMWLRPDSSQTTYENHYQDKTKETESLQPRPASPTRRNNPHPPMVFMSCRLHTVPGFYNPNAAVGKDAYRVDGSVGFHDYRQRAALKSKFTNRPSTAAILQYSRPQELGVIKDPVERQATEAWLKLANDSDREAVGGAIMEAYSDEQYRKVHGFDFNNNMNPEIKPSIFRFNKIAGPSERERLNQMVQSSNFHHQRRPKTSIGFMRFHDIEKTKQVTYTHKPKRGDFLLHPQWPPSMPHHRLSGLSSVEIPYGTGKR